MTMEFPSDFSLSRTWIHITMLHYFHLNLIIFMYIPDTRNPGTTRRPSLNVMMLSTCDTAIFGMWTTIENWGTPSSTLMSPGSTRTTQQSSAGWMRKEEEGRCHRQEREDESSCSMQVRTCEAYNTQMPL